MTTKTAILRQTMRLAAPALIIAAGVAGFMILGKGQQELAPDAPPTGPPAVRVAAVVEHGRQLDLRVDGVVWPHREIELSAEVSGVVASKSEACQAGEFVVKGTPLIQIDSRDYEFEVRRLQSLLRQAEADLKELDQEEANTRELLELVNKELVLQSREFDRLKSLASRGVVTESDLDRAEQAVLTVRNTKVSRESQLAILGKRRVRLESAVNLAESQLEKALLDVERTTIVAPVDGVIMRESVEAGSFVQRGTMLLTIEDTSRVEVKCNLEMDQLYWIWDQPRGARVSRATPDSSPIPAMNSNGSAADYRLPPTEVTIEYRMAGRGDIVYQWSGTLSHFDGMGLDERTRTAPCRVIVDDPRAVRAVQARTGSTTSVATGPQALMRGMFVTVVIHTQPASRIVRVPEAALRPGDQIYRVRDGQLSILDNVHIVRRTLSRWSEQASYRLVRIDTDVLSHDDLVVVGPLNHVQQGMAVSPIQATAAEASRVTSSVSPDFSEERSR